MVRVLTLQTTLIFPYTIYLDHFRRTEHMTRRDSPTYVRFALIALIFVLGAYWVGARYGPRQAEKVEARRVPAADPRPLAESQHTAPEHLEGLTDEESTN